MPKLAKGAATILRKYRAMLKKEKAEFRALEDSRLSLLKYHQRLDSHSANRLADLRKQIPVRIHEINRLAAGGPLVFSGKRRLSHKW